MKRLSSIQDIEENEADMEKSKGGILHDKLEVQNGIHGQPSLDLEVKIKDEESYKDF